MLLVGRQAVVEAFRADAPIRKITVARSARGAAIDEIAQAAQDAGVPVELVQDRKVDLLAGDDRSHQGVVAECEPPTLVDVEAFAAARQGRQWVTAILVLDQVHNPSNVGMILRTAAAAGLHGVLLPRHGTAPLGPQVIKAASGIVHSIPILDAATTIDGLEALRNSGFACVGLDASGVDMYVGDFPDRCAFVLGNETSGMAETTVELLDNTFAVPLSNGVESLNVAAAAAVLSYEWARRRP